MRHANRSGPTSVIKAGFAYFAMIFPIAFAMGIIRVMLVAPAVGETAAVAVELLVLLSVSWFASSFLSRRLRTEGLIPRLGMGVVALCLILSGESVIALAWLNRTLLESLDGFQNADVLLGLIGQIIFALMPAAQWLHGRRAP